MDKCGRYELFTGYYAIRHIIQEKAESDHENAPVLPSETEPWREKA
jgi:hypothetical protein